MRSTPPTLKPIPPCREAPAAAAPPPPMLPLAVKAAMPLKVIMVVDCDTELLEFTAGLLADSNYSVMAAHSGKEAVELAASVKGEIHLLLTAFHMPDMGGIDLATEIRRGRPRIAVLLMSEFPDGVLVLNEGWHFMPKPYIPSQFRALILGTLAVAEDKSLA